MVEPRIGCVKYLNARPLIRGWPGSVLFDDPARLCRRLSTGELDVALVSSIEYLRHPCYWIVDGVSISARCRVYSVVVAHQEDLTATDQIEVDPASETSVALLRCLLGDKKSNKVRTHGEARPAAARLLIGDQAIRFRQAHPDYRFWDLAEEWNKATGLPFVFALWLVRREVPDAQLIAHRLRAQRDYNLAHIEQLIADEPDFDRDFCRKYFRENLRFYFGGEEKKALGEFHQCCVHAGIDVAPGFQLNVL